MKRHHLDMINALSIAALIGLFLAWSLIVA